MHLTPENIPRHLVEMVNSYLSDRLLVAEGNNDLLTFPGYAGVPQGSVLGPFLWNVVFDEVVN